MVAGQRKNLHYSTRARDTKTLYIYHASRIIIYLYDITVVHPKKLVGDTGKTTDNPTSHNLTHKTIEMSLRARNVGTNSASKGLAAPNQYQHADDLEGGGVSSNNNSRNSSNGSLNRMEIDSGTSVNVGGGVPASNNSMRVSHAFNGKSGILADLTSGSTIELFQKSLGVLAIICILARLILPIDFAILCIVYASCGFGAVICLWLSRVVLQSDDGTPEMRAVSDPIKEGAEGFLKVQYTVRNAMHCLSID